MECKFPTDQVLLAENAELRVQLEEAKETLRAIRSGEVDALVVDSSSGPRVFTLQGLDAELNRFRSEILGQVSDAVIAVDNEQRVTYLNGAAERQYGITAAEALGRCLNELYEYRWLRPEDADASITALRERGHWRGENLHIKRNGEVLHVESSVSVLHGENGTHSGLLAVIRDITERKRTEEALKRSVEQTSLLINNLPGFVFFKDANLRYLMSNNRACQLLGRSLEDIIGKDDFELFPAQYAKKYSMDDRLVLESGEPLLIDNEENVEDGQPVIFSTRKVPIKDGSGKVTGLIGLSIDITERKRMEEALRESEFRYRSLFENNLDAIFTMDSEGRFLTVNPAAQALSGFSSEELQAMTFIDLCAPEHLEKSMDSFLASMHEQQPGIETAILSKEGRRVELFVSGVPVIANGAIVGLFCIARDITLHKRAQLERSLTIELLELVNSKDSIRSLMQAVTVFFQHHSGCDAVGVRLRDGDDYPYFEARGFSPEFLDREKNHCARGSNGFRQRDANENLLFECLCGRILGNQGGSKECLTANGSFWTSDAQSLAKAFPEALIHQKRCQCTVLGYQSVALIPLGTKNNRIGLLQLNSRNKSHFTPEFISHLDRLAEKLSIGVAKFQAEEALQKAHDVLEERVAERTASLMEQTAQQEKLQEELINISEREKRVIGQELHDGLCQHLVGVAMMTGMMHRSLAARQAPETDQAKAICDLLSSGAHEARNLSHGLHPVKAEGTGLMDALSELAQTVTKLFHVQCLFRCNGTVLIRDQTAATHLFRMAQEAVNNALKHGHSSRVVITLKNESKGVSLSIRDNGIGIPSNLPDSKGMGMQIMNHRAEAIGGEIAIRRAGKRGTVVICTLPGTDVARSPHRSTNCKAGIAD